MNVIEKIKQLGHGASAIAEWLGSGGEVVDANTAQERADTCLACPLHNPDQNATVLIGEAVRRVLEAKNKIGLRVNNEDKLGSCSVCGCVLKLQVFEPVFLLEKQTAKDAGYAPQCWKVKS